MSPRRVLSFADRYFAKVDYSGGPDACWPWLGAKSLKSSGYYGHIRASEPPHRVLLAHRVALFLYTGDWGEGMDAAHEDGCTSTLCVNPRHLRWATRRGNMADNDRRYGRVNGKFGKRKGQAV